MDPEITVAPADTPAPPAAPAATSPTNPLLVTSSSSRADYAENTSKMQTAVANLPTSQTYTYIDKTGAEKTVNATSPEAAIQTAPDIDPHSGVQQYPAPGEEGAQPAQKAPAAPATSAKTNPDGSTNNDDGTVTTADGVRLAPGLVSTYTSTTKQLDQGIAQAKSNLAQAAATMQNDPAMQNAINLVMAKYDQQIQVMKERNRQLAGGNIVGAARSGSMQFANEMTSNFLSDEQGRAEKRVTDLITLEAEMVLKTQEAYKKGDVAAFDAASKALDRAQTGKSKAISDLLKATDTVVKEQQAQQKIDATRAKQQITDDIRLSTGIAQTIAETLASASITDDKKRRAYIEGMAARNGITNPDLLESAVAKAELSTRNTNSIISKRGSTGGGSTSGKKYKDGGYTYTDNDVATYTSLLNKGGTAPDGTVLNGRGTDKYVDPGAYTYALDDWVSNGGTPQGFAKKFPVKGTVNPSSYSKLPAAIRPAATKTTSKAPA